MNYKSPHMAPPQLPSPALPKPLPGLLRCPPCLLPGRPGMSSRCPPVARKRCAVTCKGHVVTQAARTQQRRLAQHVHTHSELCVLLFAGGETGIPCCTCCQACSDIPPSIIASPKQKTVPPPPNELNKKPGGKFYY